MRELHPLAARSHRANVSKCNQHQPWFHALLKCLSLSSTPPARRSSPSYQSVRTSPHIDFSFRLAGDATEPPRVTLIVDGASTSLNNLCHMFAQLKVDLVRSETNGQVHVEHDRWCLGSLDAYTFTLANGTSRSFTACVNKLKRYQLARNGLFWFSFPRLTMQVDFLDASLNPREASDTNDAFEKKLCPMNKGVYVEISCGALVSLGTFHCFETMKKLSGSARTWKMTFYDDHFDIDFHKSSNDSPLEENRKRIKSAFIDNCAVVNTLNDGFLIYLNMKANCIDYFSK